MEISRSRRISDTIKLTLHDYILKKYFQKFFFVLHLN